MVVTKPTLARRDTMSQQEYSTKSGEKKHLKEKDRYQIEALVKAKKQAKEIAEIIHRAA